MSQTICQVLHSLNVGGAEMLAYRLAKQLDGRFRFVFACLDEVGSLGDELLAGGMPIEWLRRRRGWDLGCARRLAAFVRREKVDLIHAHQYTPFAYSLLSGLWGRRPPVLFNEHGRFYPDRRRLKRVVFNRLMLRPRDRVVAVGRAVRQALIDKEGLSPARIAVIYNGVRLEDFRRDTATRDAVRGELGIAADQFVAIQVARLDYLKDHATAVRTAERVSRRYPDFQLLVVGEGPERAKIEAEIARRSVASHVRLLGLRSDVRRLLTAADLFLLTSISEGIPVTFLEAMGACLPVVATDVGGVSEVLQHGVTGLLTPAGDDEALAAAVERIVHDPALRERLGNQGRERAQAIFSEGEMHRRYVDIYGQMLGR